MTINGNESNTHFQEVTIPGFDVSCAVASDQPLGLCLGSESGEIRFFNYSSKQMLPRSNVAGPMARTGEAVNGVAFAGELMAVSSRSEIVFAPILGRGERPLKVAVAHLGAHGVAATPGGRFVAPLGPDGLLAMGPGGAEAVRIPGFEGRDLNFYKVAPLSYRSGEDVIVCAARSSGMAVVTLRDDQTARLDRSFRRPGLDIVDVSGLALAEAPLAAVALGRDRSIRLMRDVVDGPRLSSMPLDEVRGTPYRILAARGHVFVLTSKGLYTLPNLASEFIRGSNISVHKHIYQLEIRAIDISVAFGRIVVVTDQGRLNVIEIEALTGERESIEAPTRERESETGSEPAGEEWEESTRVPSSGAQQVELQTA